MILGRLSFLAVLTVAPFAQHPTAQAPPPPTVTIVIVRHAEAVPNSGADAVLSEAGAARAKALADALKDADVRVVITTQYQRTILTGEPLATAAKAQLVKDRVAGPVGAYVQHTVSSALAKYAGGTIVIVGHSNTVPALVKGFSGIDIGDIAHDSYDQMFVITTNSAGVGRVVRARYGRPGL